MKDKTSRFYELLAALILGGYCVVMIIYSQLHPINTNVNGMKSYTFPVFLYIIMLACCVVLIIQNRIMAAKQKKRWSEMSEQEKSSLDEETKNQFRFVRTDKRVWITIALLIIYVALWNVIGFLLSTLLFVVAETKALKKEVSLLKCFLFAIAVDVVVYLIFCVIFSISLPETFLAAIL